MVVRMPFVRVMSTRYVVYISQLLWAGRLAVFLPYMPPSHFFFISSLSAFFTNLTPFQFLEGNQLRGLFNESTLTRSVLFTKPDFPNRIPPVEPCLAGIGGNPQSFSSWVYIESSIINITTQAVE